MPKLLKFVVLAVLLAVLASASNASASSTVTIAADSASVSEGASASFTVTATPVPTSNLRVNVGEGSQGTNQSILRQVTIPASGNNAGSATFTVGTVQDDVDKPKGSSGTVVATVNSGTGYTVGTPSSATVEITDDDPTVVSLARVGSGAVTEGETAEFTVTLSRELVAGEVIDVPLRMAGGGQHWWQDLYYSKKSGTGLNTGVSLAFNPNVIERTRVVRFSGLGAKTATILIETRDDNTAEGGDAGAENFTFTLGSNTAFDANSRRTNVGGGARRSADAAMHSFKLQVKDFVSPVPTLKVEAPTVIEGDSGVIKLTLSRPATQNIDVGIYIGGTDCSQFSPNICPPGVDTASWSTDYYSSSFPGQTTDFTFAPGETSKTFAFTTTDDSTVESTEIFVMSLRYLHPNEATLDSSTPPYGFYSRSGGAGGVEAYWYVRILDNDNPKNPNITIAPGTSSVTEGSPATFTLTATPTPADSFNVNMMVSGTGNGAPSAEIGSKQVLFPATANTATFSVRTSDGVDDPTGTVGTIVATVDSGTGYTVANSISASVEIEDGDPTVVSLARTGFGPIDEGEAVEFKVTLGRALKAGEIVHVPLEIGGAGVVPADWNLSKHSDAKLNKGVSFSRLQSSTPVVIFTGAGAKSSTLILTAEHDDTAEGNGSDFETFAIALGSNEAFVSNTLGTNVGGGANPHPNPAMHRFEVKVNDVATAGVPTLKVEVPTVIEGDSATIKFTLSHPLNEPVVAYVQHIEVAGTTTADPTNDFSFPPQLTSIDFNRGVTTKTVSFTTTDDSVSESTEVFVFGLLLANSSQVTIDSDTLPDSIDTSSQPQMLQWNVYIYDNDNSANPYITIASNDSAVAEGLPATFTVTATPAPTASFTVDLTASDALRGGTRSRQSSILAGSTTATFTVPTIDGTDYSTGATPDIVATLDAGAGYIVGTPSSASVAVNDEDPTVVSLNRVGSGAVDEGQSVEFTIDLSRALIGGEIIDVPLRIGGMGITTDDWGLSEKPGTGLNSGVRLSGINTSTPMVRFRGEGTKTATLVLGVPADNLAEGDGAGAETLEVSLGSNLAFDAQVLGTNVGGGADPHASAAMNSFEIKVNDTTATSSAPTLKVKVPAVTEGEKGVIELVLSHPVSDPVQFFVRSLVCSDALAPRCPEDTGKAKLGEDFSTDFSQSSISLTFAPGETYKSLLYTTSDDSDVELTEVFYFALNSLDPSKAAIDLSTLPDVSKGRNSAGADAYWYVRIVDNDSTANPNVTIAPGESPVTEGTDATFIVTAVPAPAAGIDVNVAISEVITGAASKQIGSQSVSVPASTGHASTATLTVTTADTVDEPTGRIVASIKPGNRYKVGAVASATVEVEDDDSTTVMLAREGSAGISEDGGTVDVAVTLGRQLAAGESVTVPLVVTGATVDTHYTYALTDDSDSISLSALSPHNTQNPAVIFSGAGARGAILRFTGVDNSDQTARTLSVDYGTGVRAPFSSGLSGGLTTTGSVAVPIIDDENMISVTGAQAAEGNAVEFAVTLPQAAPSGGVDIVYSTSNGRGEQSDASHQVATTADYTSASSETLTIAQGQRSGTVSIATTDDQTYESDHYFTLTLDSTNQFSLNLSANTAIGTITDEQDLPRFGFSTPSTTANEGDGTVTLTVEKTGTTLLDASVSYATFDATATGGSDYTVIKSTDLVFGKDDTSKELTVTLRDDAADEMTEAFTVDLIATAGARLDTASSHSVEIADNDATRVRLSSAAESAIAEDGETTLIIDLNRALTGDEKLSVPLVVWGDASLGSDYTLSGVALSGVSYTNLNSTDLVNEPPTVSFSGAANASRRAELTVKSIDDAVDEADLESVIVGLGAIDASLAMNLDGGVTGSGLVDFPIEDNDDLPVLSIDAPSATEGNKLQFTVTLTPQSDKEVSVDYAEISGGTATSGVDYDELPAGTLIFPAGETTRNISITVLDDNSDESMDETVTVQLLSADNATLEGGGITLNSMGTIIDVNPTVVSLARTGSGAIDEGQNIEFTVTLVRELIANEIVDVPLDIGGAGVTTADWFLLEKAGASLNTGVSLSGTGTSTPVVRFSGARAKVATLVLGTPIDNIAEGGGTNLETIDVALGTKAAFSAGALGTNVDGGAVPNPVAAMSSFDIVVNDITAASAVPKLKVNVPAVIEGESGTIAIALSHTVNQSIVVNYSASQCTTSIPCPQGTNAASTASDLSFSSGSITFTPGETVKTISFATTDDNSNESTEAFLFVLDLLNSTKDLVFDAGTPADGTTVSEAYWFVRIHDNDNPANPSIAIAAGAAPAEGTGARFTVTATPTPSANITVNVTVSDIGGGAASGQTGARQVTIPASGNSAGTVSFTVATANDEVDNPRGAAIVANVNPGTGYTTGESTSATAEITDDEPTVVSLARVGSGAIDEGEAIELTVTLSRELIADEIIDVPLRINGGGRLWWHDLSLSKKSGSSINSGVNLPAVDFWERTRVVRFKGPGARTATLLLQTSIDNIAEGGDAGGETFTINLGSDTAFDANTRRTNVGGGARRNADAALHSFDLQVNDAVEPVPTLKVEAPTVVEGERGAVKLTLSRPARRSFEIGIFIGGSGCAPIASTFCPPGVERATWNVDYQSSDFPRSATTITFAAGETSKTFAFTAIDDSMIEGTEFFHIALYDLLPIDATLDFNAPPAGFYESSGRIGDVDAYWYAYILDNDDPANPNVTIAPGTSPVTEGTDANFTVTAAPAPATDLTVNVSVSETGNVADSDDVGSKPVTVPAAGSQNEGTATLTVSTIADTVDERNGAILATLGSGTGYTLVTSTSATVDVLDDDATTVTLARSGSGGIVEDGGTVDVTVTLGRQLVTGESVTVPLAVTGATVRTHYTYVFTDGSSGVTHNTKIPHSIQNLAVIFSGAGAKTATVRFTAVDNNDQTSRVLNIAYGTGIRAPSSTGLSGGIKAVGSIAIPLVDDDAGISLAAASAAEGNAVEFTVTLPQAAPSGGVDIVYSTSNGRGEQSDAPHQVATTADYTSASGATLTIAEGDNSGTVSIATTDDQTYESDHYFELTLDSTNHFSIDPSASSAIGTITDEDDVPSFEFSKSSTTASEGDGTLTLTVEKTGTTMLDATLNFTTVDGTATGGSDFTAIKDAKLVFGKDDASKEITVSLVDDVADEPTQTFGAVLSADSHSRLGGTTSHNIEITDNDATEVTLASSFDGDKVPETEERYPVIIELNRVLTGDETLAVPLVFGGDATFGSDYWLSVSDSEIPGVRFMNLASTNLTDNPPTIVFSGEATAVRSASVIFNVRKDDIDENAESVTVELGTLDGNSGANLDGGATGSGTVGLTINDSNRLPVLSIDAPSAAEGGTLRFTVTLTPMSGKEVTVDYAEIAGGTATQGVDYTALTAGTLTFTPGQTTQHIDVAVLDSNTIDESIGKTMKVQLSNAVNASLMGGGNTLDGTGTIADNDPTVVSLARTGSGAIDEGKAFEFTVTLARTLIAGEIIDVPLQIGGTGVTTADWSLVTKSGMAINTGVSLSNTGTMTPVVRFEGAGAQIATLLIGAKIDNTAEGGGANQETFEIALGSNADFDANTLGTNVLGGADPHASAAMNSFEVVVNDITGSVKPTLRIDIPTVTEGESGAIELTLSRPADKRLVFNFGIDECDTSYTSPCPPGRKPASLDVDFSVQARYPPLLVGFAPGETKKSIPYTTTDDSSVESTEIFYLLLFGDFNANEIEIDPSTLPDDSVDYPHWHAAILDNDNPANPNIAISSGTSPVTEGTDASFQVTATPAPTANLTVDVAVSEAGNFTAAGGIGSKQVTIPSATSQNAGTATLTVSTDDDKVDELDGAIVATVDSGNGYTVGKPASATVEVQDNDATTVTLARSGSGGIAEDGGTVDVTVTLGRPLVAGESVSAPVVFSGATHATHYTYVFEGGTGVTLEKMDGFLFTDDRPKVNFAGAGAKQAKFTFTAVNNNDQTERTLLVKFGSVGFRTILVRAFGWHQPAWVCIRAHCRRRWRGECGRHQRAGRRCGGIHRDSSASRAKRGCGHRLFDIGRTRTVGRRGPSGCNQLSRLYGRAVRRSLLPKVKKAAP